MAHANKTKIQRPQRLAAAGVLLGLLVSVACQPTAPARMDAADAVATAPAASTEVQAASASTVAVPASKASQDNPDVGDAIKLASSYNEMKASLEAHGWKPASNPKCLIDVVGKDAVAECAAHPEWESCSYCSDLPGLTQCSADGFCLFVFEQESGVTRLEVTMKGDIGEWRVNAPDTLFGVNGWRIKKSE